LFPHTPNSSFQTYSAPSGLVKIVRSIQGAVPLATYYAPLGLKPPDKFRNPPAGGQVFFYHGILGLCPKPHILFCLDTKKYAKKVKAAPASHEKATLGG